MTLEVIAISVRAFVVVDRPSSITSRGTKRISNHRTKLRKIMQKFGFFSMPGRLPGWSVKVAAQCFVTSVLSVHYCCRYWQPNGKLIK